MGARQAGESGRGRGWDDTGRGRGIGRRKHWPGLTAEGGRSLASQRRAAPERECISTHMAPNEAFLKTIMGIYVSDIFSACPCTATSHAQFLVLNEDSRNAACPNPQGG